LIDFIWAFPLAFYDSFQKRGSPVRIAARALNKKNPQTRYNHALQSGELLPPLYPVKYCPIVLRSCSFARHA
jgi:hypothetical protein